MVKLLVKRFKRKQKRGDHRGGRQSSEVPRINGRALTLHQTTPIKLWVITSLIKVPHLETWAAFVPISRTLFPFDALKGSNGLMAFSEEAILEQELTLSILLLEVPGLTDKQWVPPADHNYILQYLTTLVRGRGVGGIKPETVAYFWRTSSQR